MLRSALAKRLLEGGGHGVGYILRKQNGIDLDRRRTGLLLVRWSTCDWSHGFLRRVTRRVSFNLFNDGRCAAQLHDIYVFRGGKPAFDITPSTDDVVSAHVI